MLSLVIFVSTLVSNFVNFGAWYFCKSLLVYGSTWPCVFIANFFGYFTFQSPGNLYCYSQDGLYQLKITARFRFRFPGHIRVIRRPVKKKSIERSPGIGRPFYKRADGVTP